MRIAILAHNLSAGGGRYLGQAIVEALLRKRPTDRFLITCPSSGWNNVHCPPHGRLVAIGAPFTSLLKRLYGELCIVRREVGRFRPDVVLAAGNFGLLKPPCPQIVVVHESHLCYPARHYGPLPWHLRLQVELQRPYFRRQLQNTGLILCQTNVMATRVQRLYGFGGSVAILPNILTPNHLRADAPTAGVAARADRAGGDLRLAYITRYYAHKNLEGLVETFASQSPELRGVRVFTTLDPSGLDGGGRILDRIASSPAAEHIVNLGPIPQSSVGWMLERLDGVIIPTLLESFSASYLEAMQHGRPILTSDLDFAHEICGASAVYFNPWDSADIASKIRCVRDDAGLRASLAKSSRARLADVVCESEEFADILWGAIERSLKSPSANRV